VFYSLSWQLAHIDHVRELARVPLPGISDDGAEMRGDRYGFGLVVPIKLIFIASAFEDRPESFGPHYNRFVRFRRAGIWKGL
jgi:hypothetical protein